MNVLDLFCCEGGASVGYALAGHSLRGVDFSDTHQAFYPYEYYNMDWRVGLAGLAGWADFIHASPPCQGYSVMNGTYAVSSQQRLIPEVRAALLDTQKPFVIENVAGAKRELVNPVRLTGDMFGLGATLTVDPPRPWVARNPGGKGDKVHDALCPGSQVIEAKIERARYFEFGNMDAPKPPRRKRDDRQNFSVINGSTTEDFHRLGHRDLTVEQRQALLGIDWPMSKLGLAESLPPAYTRWIGEKFLEGI